jgi:hypothetical protein
VTRRQAYIQLGKLRGKHIVTITACAQVVSVTCTIYMVQTLCASAERVEQARIISSLGIHDTNSNWRREHSLGLCLLVIVCHVNLSHSTHSAKTGSCPRVYLLRSDEKA